MAVNNACVKLPPTGVWIWAIQRAAERDCPKRGRNGDSALDLASIRTPKQPDKYHFGVPYGYVVGASETFRTVSKDVFSETRMAPVLLFMARPIRG